MKVVVFAYHNIGCTGLRALQAAGFEIAAVFTHKDDPSEQRFFSSVAEWCAEQDLPLFAPDEINHPLWIERIRALAPDLIFSFYYRDMLGQELLDIPPLGAYTCMALCCRAIVAGPRPTGYWSGGRRKPASPCTR